MHSSYVAICCSHTRTVPDGAWQSMETREVSMHDQSLLLHACVCQHVPGTVSCHCVQAYHKCFSQSEILKEQFILHHITHGVPCRAIDTQIHSIHKNSSLWNWYVTCYGIQKGCLATAYIRIINYICWSREELKGLSLQESVTIYYCYTVLHTVISLKEKKLHRGPLIVF